MRRSEVTLQRSWQNIAPFTLPVTAIAVSASYSRLGRRPFADDPAEPRCRERLFIKYALTTLELIDLATGEVRKRHLSVAALGASSLSYAELDAGPVRLDRLALCAFALVGDVPAMVVSGNIVRRHLGRVGAIYRWLLEASLGDARA